MAVSSLGCGAAESLGFRGLGVIGLGARIQKFPKT